MSISRITLNDGTKAPWLAFGSGTALYNKDASSPIEVAIKTGIDHLDAAEVYDNEESVGEGIKKAGKPRNELYITTKLARLNPGQSVRDVLQTSLKKLGVDYVDLYLIHTPMPFIERLPEIWKEFEAVKKEGLTKSIGVSNFTAEHLQKIMQGAEVIPAVNQIEYHLYVSKAAQPIIKFCAEHKIVVASYGGLTPIVRASGGPIDPVVEEVRERLAKTYGKPVSAGQVLTKLLQQEGVLVVTTTTKEERIREFIDVANIPELTKEEVVKLKEAGSKLHKRIFMKNCFNE
jgi:diketogulonate reductase-like aldo/keto reductase